MKMPTANATTRSSLAALTNALVQAGVLMAVAGLPRPAGAAIAPVTQPVRVASAPLLYLAQNTNDGYGAVPAATPKRGISGAGTSAAPAKGVPGVKPEAARPATGAAPAKPAPQADARDSSR